MVFNLAKVELLEFVPCLVCNSRCYPVPEKKYYHCTSCKKNIFPRDYLPTFIYIIEDNDKEIYKLGITTDFNILLNYVGYWECANYLIATAIQKNTRNILKKIFISDPRKVSGNSPKQFIKKENLFSLIERIEFSKNKKMSSQ